MKYPKLVPAIVLISTIVFISLGASAADTNPAGSTSTNSVAATAPVPYPLDTCIISGDKFGGDMGPPVVFIYQDKAKGINQEIKFCCPMCKPKFLADPDKYMKIIQAAEAKAKSKGAKN
jgi:hypothetical protein